MPTQSILYGGYTAMAVPALQSLVSDATDPYTAWQSARVSNIATGTFALDYEILIDLATAATAPAGDAAAYAYLVPWVFDGTIFLPGANFGTVTAPTGAEGTAVVSDLNSMKGPFPIPYKATSQRLQAWFTVAQLCGGGVVPDGWSLAIRNASGAALGTGCVVAYRPINWSSN